MSAPQSPPQSPGVRGWGRDGSYFTDWRREHTWLGRHTLVAALLGLALPIIIAALAGAFAAPPPQGAAPDRERMRVEHPTVWNTAYERALPRARAEAIIHLVVYERRAPESPWAEGVAAGWSDGWTEAIAAMRQAAEDAALSPDAVEWRILDQLTERGPDIN